MIKHLSSQFPHSTPIRGARCRQRGTERWWNGGIVKKDVLELIRHRVTRQAHRRASSHSNTRTPLTSDVHVITSPINCHGVPYKQMSSGMSRCGVCVRGGVMLLLWIRELSQLKPLPQSIPSKLFNQPHNCNRQQQTPLLQKQNPLLHPATNRNPPLMLQRLKDNQPQRKCFPPRNLLGQPPTQMWLARNPLQH